MAARFPRVVAHALLVVASMLRPLVWSFKEGVPFICGRTWSRNARRPRRLSTPASASPSSEAAAPLFRFGLLTDVQFADIPDGAGFSGRPRYYRNSLVSLGLAVDDWRRSDVDFGVHLGDILDGFCPRNQSAGALQRVLGEFDRFEGPVRHLLGNHCLYNLPREVLKQRLQIVCPEAGCAYYSFTHKGVCFVALDGYDIAIEGWPEGHPKRKRAEKILGDCNPNRNQNNPSGLEGLMKRFVRFNGGVGNAQLLWLGKVLRKARSRGEKAVVLAHQPLHPDASNPVCLLWNYEEVLDVLYQFQNTVVACFSGHAHRGGYAFDRGIHHRVVEAVLETPPGTDAHGVVEVYTDRLEIRGKGAVQSAVLPFHRKAAELDSYSQS